VIALFQKNQRAEWTVPDIQSELEKGGAAPEAKALYNALNYLAKSGRLRRVARGRYVVAHIGVEVDYDDFDDGTTRLTEHD
jgi:Fe2+ or Zn2+ uptake regulation protein